MSCGGGFFTGPGSLMSMLYGEPRDFRKTRFVKTSIGTLLVGALGALLALTLGDKIHLGSLRKEEKRRYNEWLSSVRRDFPAFPGFHKMSREWYKKEFVDNLAMRGNAEDITMQKIKDYSADHNIDLPSWYIRKLNGQLNNMGVEFKDDQAGRREYLRTKVEADQLNNIIDRVSGLRDLEEIPFYD